MNPILEKYLTKLGIKDVKDLQPEEKVDFDRWSKILSEGEITLEKVMEFCKSQVSLIESQWKNTDNSERKNDRLIQQHTVYKAIINCMDAPKQERENLERHLQSLIK